MPENYIVVRQEGLEDEYGDIVDSKGMNFGVDPYMTNDSDSRERDPSMPPVNGIFYRA